MDLSQVLPPSMALKYCPPSRTHKEEVRPFGLPDSDVVSGCSWSTRSCESERHVADLRTGAGISLLESGPCRPARWP
eukprot:3604596-Pyramimonas_sp.AAC.1